MKPFLNNWGGESDFPFTQGDQVFCFARTVPFNFSSKSPRSGKLLSLRDCLSLIGTELCPLKILMLKPKLPVG